MGWLDSRSELPAHTPARREARKWSGNSAASRDETTRGPGEQRGMRRVSTPMPALRLTRGCLTSRQREGKTEMVREPRDAGPELPALASIRRFLRPRAVREHCALCSAELAGEHPHLVELASRRLACACDACALLFSGPDTRRYRRVPRHVRALPDFHMTDETWEALQLPIDLAFFLDSTPAGCVIVLYPSPAGATESVVDAEAWRTLAAENPVLREFEPDVEGLLVNRVGDITHVFSRGYRRVLSPCRPDPHALARPLGRCAGLGRDRPVLRRPPRAVFLRDETIHAGPEFPG